MAGLAERLRSLAVGMDAARPLGPRRRLAAGVGAPRAAARFPDLHGRQLDRAGAPARGGRKKALGCRAIGRSRGGPSTKLHAIVEARGLPVGGVVTLSQTSDYDPAEALIGGRAGEAVIADHGYDADGVTDLIERQGSEADISNGH